MALIDFHCHLDLHADPAGAAAEAIDAEMYVLSVTTTPSAFAGTKRLAPKESRIRTALGLHPEIAVARRHEINLFRELIGETDYVGEVGLDGSPPHRATLDTQAMILSEILEICARAGGKILSLHSRGAPDLLLDLLETEPGAGRFVLHWFSAKPEAVRRATAMGCWFSVGAGMLSSAKGRAAVTEMPRDRVLPETDAPFLLQDGRPARPTDVAHAYRLLSELFAMPRQALERKMLANLRSLTATRDRLAEAGA